MGVRPENWRWEAFREGCKTCDYGHDVSTDRAEGFQCRRYPPVVLYAVGGVDGREHWEQGWPFMSPHDWCGEYKRERLSTDDPSTD